MVAEPEVERQLVAAVERHREVLAAMHQPGRPESGQHVAVKAVGRAVQPRLVEQLAPRGLDPAHVAEVAAGIEATARLQGLAQRILADIADDAWAPTPTDLVDLHERVDSSWRSWRQDIGRGH